MAYCVKCGAKVDDNTVFCPQCGAEIPAMDKNKNTGYDQEYTYYQDADYSRQDAYHPDMGEYFDAEDVRKNKAMGVLSYVGILVLIPLLAGNKNSPYVRFHANQGLVLFIVSVLVDLLDGDFIFGLHSLIHFDIGIFSWAFDILSLICFILMIAGIVAACKGEKRELPIIGKIRILK